MHFRSTSATVHRKRMWKPHIVSGFRWENQKFFKLETFTNFCNGQCEIRTSCDVSRQCDRMLFFIQTNEVLSSGTKPYQRRFKILPSSRIRFKLPQSVAKKLIFINYSQRNCLSQVAADPQRSLIGPLIDDEFYIIVDFFLFSFQSARHELKHERPPDRQTGKKCELCHFHSGKRQLLQDRLLRGHLLNSTQNIFLSATNGRMNNTL